MGRANQENAIRQRLVANVIGEPGLRCLTKQGGAAAFYLGLLSARMKTFQDRTGCTDEDEVEISKCPRRRISWSGLIAPGVSKLDLIRSLDNSMSRHVTLAKIG